jgi:hypothetical protein
MVGSNTETGIAVTYEDGDNTLDFVIGAGAIVNSMLADDAVGADELAANAVVNASIASGAAIDMDKLDGDSLATAITDFAQDDLVILSDTSDSGNLVKITTSNFEDAIFGNISGDATVAAGGALTIANDAVEQAMIADDAVGADQLAASAVVNASIVDDAISYEKIDDEFSTVDALSAGATVNVDFDAAQVFTLTPNQNTTLNVTNPKIGITKTIVMTGSGGSRTLAFTVGGSSGTFNKIAGDYNDTSSTKNLIQITCVAASEFWYSINQIAS